MTNPKFSVGERVLLQAKKVTQWNGAIFEVLLVIHHPEPWVCPWTNHICISNQTKGFSYVLNDESMQRANNNGRVSAMHWVESALRKIPPTSEYSFEELMSKLKTGTLETV